MVLKPSPTDIVDRYLGSLRALGIDTEVNDIRFVEDNWEKSNSWRMGFRLGSLDERHGSYSVHLFPTGRRYSLQNRLQVKLHTVWKDLVCIFKTATTYLIWFIPAGPTERKEHVLTYGDVFHQNEVEQSHYNFEASDPEKLLKQFDYFESEAKRLMDLNLALPAYEMVLKAGHTFNLLDARGAISVTERAAYIGRIRQISRSVAQSYYDSRERLGFPMCSKEG